MAINLHELLWKIASSKDLYQPLPHEQPSIKELIQQQFIMAVKLGNRQGYHITINGVRWRNQVCRSEV